MARLQSANTRGQSAKMRSLPKPKPQKTASKAPTKAPTKAAAAPNGAVTATAGARHPTLAAVFAKQAAAAANDTTPPDFSFASLYYQLERLLERERYIPRHQNIR